MFKSRSKSKSIGCLSILVLRCWATSSSPKGSIDEIQSKEKERKQVEEQVLENEECIRTEQCHEHHQAKDGDHEYSKQGLLGCFRTLIAICLTWPIYVQAADIVPREIQGDKWKEAKAQGYSSILITTSTEE